MYGKHAAVKRLERTCILRHGCYLLMVPCAMHVPSPVCHKTVLTVCKVMNHYVNLGSWWVSRTLRARDRTKGTGW